MKNIIDFFTARREGIKTAIILIVVVIVLTACSSVFGYAQFKTEFKKLYVSAHSPQEFKDLVFKASCAICHDQNEKKPSGTLNKKFRNPYGEALDELLDKGDKKDKLKIQEALKKVADQKYSGYDKTYGKRIENHQLPYDVPISE